MAIKKEYWNKTFHNWFKLPKHAKITFYRNPNECSTFFNGGDYPEKEKFFIEPDNTIWGNRNRKNRKIYGNNPLRVGRVFYPLLSYPFLDKILYLFNYFADNLGIMMCCYYIFLALIVMGFITQIPMLEVLFAGRSHFIFSS